MDDQLMQVSCDPMCGFKIQSHNMDELKSVVKDHVLKQHQKKATDAEVEEMMTPVMA